MTSAPSPASNSPVYSARSSAISITRKPASMPGPALSIISPGPRATAPASDMALLPLHVMPWLLPGVWIDAARKSCGKDSAGYPWSWPIGPGGSSGRAQFRGDRAVERTVLGESDAVVAQRRLARDQPVGDIERHLLGIAFGGIAEPAAARQFEADEIAARDALPALGADRLAGSQGNAAGSTSAA